MGSRHTLGSASRGGLVLAALGLSMLVGCGAEEQVADIPAPPEEAAATPEGGGEVNAMYTCLDMSCNYKDPQSAGCAADPNVRTLCSMPTNNGIVELRFSPACKAMWTRTRRADSRTWDAMAARITVGSAVANQAPLSGYDAVWSPMLSPANASNRCGKAEGWFYVSGSVASYNTCQACAY